MVVIFFILTGCGNSSNKNNELNIKNEPVTEESSIEKCELPEIITVGVESENEAEVDSRTYYFITPYFRLWEVNDDGENRWQYEITKPYSNSVVFTGAHYRQPTITHIAGNVVRVSCPYGSNSNELRYYDTQNEVASECFLWPYFCVNPEFVEDYSTGDLKALIVYSDYCDKRNKKLTIISSIFDDSFYLEIEEDFYSASAMGIYNAIFLNENELFIEYFIFENDEQINKRAIIIFDNDGYEYREFPG